jgi:putative sigma-54 modulation protein
MDMHITGKNLTLSPEAREYISRKMNKITRYIPNILSFDVVASEENARAPDQRFIIQVTLDSNGTLIRGEERAQDVHSATDKAFEVISRQIERYKKRFEVAKARGAPSIRRDTTEVTEMAAGEPAEAGPRLARIKRFTVKPMSWEEAIDQMELLGHDFFLYYDPDTNNINLVYRRKDGSYGMIETRK